MPIIRRGEVADLPQIAAIQQASPEAAQWQVTEYLAYDLRVALCDDRVAGFLVTRPVAPDEWEILNLAVAPEFRRRGIARALFEAFLSPVSLVAFLEVRASNTAARNFYKSIGFQEVSMRPEYYGFPPEPGIVMKFHSC
jgi:ribosomal-protein-alanine N-acetyltransferase